MWVTRPGFPEVLVLQERVGIVKKLSPGMGEGYVGGPGHVGGGRGRQEGLSRLHSSLPSLPQLAAASPDEEEQRQLALESTAIV